MNEFIKQLNNSAAIVMNDGKEEVVLGKGVGFGLKKGDEVDESKIERRFITADDHINVNQLQYISANTIKRYQSSC